MIWTDRIRQVKILLVSAAIVIAAASLAISHFLVADLENEEKSYGCLGRGNEDS